MYFSESNANKTYAYDVDLPQDCAGADFILDFEIVGCYTHTAATAQKTHMKA